MMHPLADRCPACGTERNAPPVEPYLVRKAKRSCVIAYYRCPHSSCRCWWFVGWDTGSIENQHREDDVA